MTPTILRSFLISTMLFAAAALSAQEIRMGGLEGNSAVFASSPITLIDWSRPATSNGTVNTASIGWTGATSPCDAIFFVRFYAIPSNAFTTVMVAERGPFRAVSGINTVTLEPPVPVTTETYIGIRRVSGPDSCGMPFGTFTRQPGRVLLTNDDFKGGSLTSVQPSNNFRLMAEASNVPSIRVATIPAVASAPGAFGAFFRTSLTLANPSATEILGKLVFRAAGRAGTDSDPSTDFDIPPNGTLTYPDILTTMGQSGLGSLDLLTTGSVTPIATARVFNDAGTAGTSGFAEDAVPAGADYLSLAMLFIPDDLTNFRLNIGIRTITAADVTVDVYNPAGAKVSTTLKSYPANYFEQVSASSFLGGGTVPAGGRIVVSAFQKEFIVYGAVTDNRTNDPSMRIGSD
jgi:hypothetical protein